MQVSPSCPEFEKVYSGLQEGIVIKLSNLNVTFEREAVMFLNAFVQGLLQRWISLLFVRPKNNFLMYF